MRTLTSITKTLQRKPFCMVTDNQVRRVWPSIEDRQATLWRFAKEHDSRLFSYIQGQGAIFVRD